MGYYIDLEKISLEKYKDILKSADLLPGRMILKDNIDNNFELLKQQDVLNIAGLIERLKNKKKLQDFSIQSGLDENYLTVLIRELKSYRQTPNKLKDFPNITETVILKLEKIGIKNTLQLYEKVTTSESRNELCKQTGIDKEIVLTLTRLTDLSRIRWVNHTFAYVLLEANYDTTEKVAKADYKELYETVKQLNSEKNLYKGQIGLHDMKLCVESAKDIPLDIEY